MVGGEVVFERCVEEFRRLLGEMPRPEPFEPEELFILRWASYKQRLAALAAKCVKSLIPGVRGVYYAELSGDDIAGRDVDIVIDVDNVGGVREVADTAEAILEKIARAAGLPEPRGLFEVHTLAENVYGSTSFRPLRRLA